MSSKFFGNRLQKNSPDKKGGKQKISNKNNKQKSTGVRKVGRGQLSFISSTNFVRLLKSFLVKV